MTRRVIALLTAGILVVGGLGVWAAWTARLGQRNTQLALQLEAERQRNFMELAGHVQSMQGLLGKGMAAGSERQNMFYMGEVYRRSSLATANFMALPLPGPIGASTGKFLNQAGDFAYSIARNEAAGRPMDRNQRAEMARLQQTAATLAGELQKVGRQATNDRFRWVGPAPRLADLFTGWRPMARLGRAGKPTQDQSPKSILPAGLAQIGPQMDRLPVLVYDGPFSDHQKKRTPSMGGAPVTEADARTRALSFVPNSSAFTVAQSTQRNGTPPVFSFRLAPGAGRPRSGGAANYTATVDVSRAGGHLVSFVNARPAGTPRLNLDQVRDLGRTYLEQHGFPGMVPTYGEAIDGFATVQYALRHRGAIIYPDQIKVRLALDNGEIVGVDAHSYVMSHRERGALAAPAVTREQAARALNPELKVQRVQLAMIPTETGDNEVLAYEFLGTMGDDTYLVYVNAKTGNEERILQMLITKHGTLAL